MATERQSGQQGEQRATGQPTERRSVDVGERAAGRGGRAQGTSVERSRGGEYQGRGGWMPSLYAGSESNPFAMMRRLSDEMDRLFESFGMGRGLFPSFEGGALGRGPEPGLWSPRVEMYERDNKLVVEVDLPGVNRDDVNVDIDEDGLTIQGERRQERTENERGFFRSERAYGQFQRRVPLPEGVNAESAQATFRDGVLQIELDMPNVQRGRRLEIKEGAARESATGAGAQSDTGSTKSPGTH